MKLLKKATTLSLLLISSLLSVQNSFAASAVYFCKETGAYGYSYEAKTLQEAQDTAFDFCQEAGGKNCLELISTEDYGYGAIAEGETDDGIPVIGAVVSAGTSKEAQEGALKYCKEAGATKNVEVKYSWKDKDTSKDTVKDTK